MSLAIRSKRSSSSFVISKAPSRRRAYVSTLPTTILVGRNHPCLALIPLLQLQAQHLEKASKVFFRRSEIPTLGLLMGKTSKVPVEKNKTKMKSFKHFQINWACSLDIRVLHCIGALTPRGFAKL